MKKNIRLLLFLLLTASTAAWSMDGDVTETPVSTDTDGKSGSADGNGDNSEDVALDHDDLDHDERTPSPTPSDQGIVDLNDPEKQPSVQSLQNVSQDGTSSVGGKNPESANKQAATDAISSERGLQLKSDIDTKNPEMNLDEQDGFSGLSDNEQDALRSYRKVKAKEFDDIQEPLENDLQSNPEMNLESQDAYQKLPDSRKKEVRDWQEQVKQNRDRVDRIQKTIESDPSVDLNENQDFKDLNPNGDEEGAARQQDFLDYQDNLQKSQGTNADNMDSGDVNQPDQTANLTDEEQNTNNGAQDPAKSKKLTENTWTFGGRDANNFDRFSREIDRAKTSEELSAIGDRLDDYTTDSTRAREKGGLERLKGDLEDRKNGTTLGKVGRDAADAADKQREKLFTKIESLNADIDKALAKQERSDNEGAYRNPTAQEINPEVARTISEKKLELKSAETEQQESPNNTAAREKVTNFQEEILELRLDGLRDKLSRLDKDSGSYDKLRTRLDDLSRYEDVGRDAGQNQYQSSAVKGDDAPISEKAQNLIKKIELASRAMSRNSSGDGLDVIKKELSKAKNNVDAWLGKDNPTEKEKALVEQKLQNFADMEKETTIERNFTKQIEHFKGRKQALEDQIKNVEQDSPQAEALQKKIADIDSTLEELEKRKKKEYEKKGKKLTEKTWTSAGRDRNNIDRFSTEIDRAKTPEELNAIEDRLSYYHSMSDASFKDGGIARLEREIQERRDNITLGKVGRDGADAVDKKREKLFTTVDKLNSDIDNALRKQQKSVKGAQRDVTINNISPKTAEDIRAKQTELTDAEAKQQARPNDTELRLRVRDLKDEVLKLRVDGLREKVAKLSKGSKRTALDEKVAQLEKQAQALNQDASNALSYNDTDPVDSNVDRLNNYGRRNLESDTDGDAGPNESNTDDDHLNDIAQRLKDAIRDRANQARETVAKRNNGNGTLSLDDVNTDSSSTDDDDDDDDLSNAIEDENGNIQTPEHLREEFDTNYFNSSPEEYEKSWNKLHENMSNEAAQRIYGNSTDPYHQEFLRGRNSSGVRFSDDELKNESDTDGAPSPNDYNEYEMDRAMREMESDASDQEEENPYQMTRPTQTLDDDGNLVVRPKTKSSFLDEINARRAQADAKAYTADGSNTEKVNRSNTTPSTDKPTRELTPQQKAINGDDDDPTYGQQSSGENWNDEDEENMV